MWFSWGWCVRGIEDDTDELDFGGVGNARASLKERRRYGKILILTTALIVPWALFILITHFDFYSATP